MRPSWRGTRTPLDVWDRDIDYGSGRKPVGNMDRNIVGGEYGPVLLFLFFLWINIICVKFSKVITKNKL